MTDNLPAYGFLGSADSKQENVELNLDSFLPMDVGLMLLPCGTDAGPGVKRVKTWLAEQFSDGDYQEVNDVIASLEAARADGCGATLIVLIDPETVADDDALLVKRALAAEIPVRSINHAMNDVTLDDVTPEQVPSAPETAVEPRTRRTRTAVTPQTSEASEAVSGPPARKPRGRARAATEVPAVPAVTEVAQGPAFWQGTGPELLALIDARIKIALQHTTFIVDTPPF